MNYVIWDDSATGGIGHTMTDYLSAYVFSHIFGLSLIYNSFEVQQAQRGMDVDNTNDKWHQFLNLEQFRTPYPQRLDNIVDAAETGFVQYHGIGMVECNAILKKLHGKHNSGVVFRHSRPRIYLFDVFHMEELCEIPKGTTARVVRHLQNAFFQVHDRPMKQDLMTINVYVRLGDMKAWCSQEDLIDFQYKIVADLIRTLKGRKFVINIMSAGSEDDRRTVMDKFGCYSQWCKFIFNEDQYDAFLRMVHSDILVFNLSSFPLLASYYCKGTIITKSSGYLQTKYKTTRFLSNYLFIDDLQEIDLTNLLSCRHSEEKKDV